MDSLRTLLKWAKMCLGSLIFCKKKKKVPLIEARAKEDRQTECEANERGIFRFGWGGENRNREQGEIKRKIFAVKPINFIRESKNL